MFRFQKVRVRLLCALLLSLLFIYLGSFSIDSSLTVSAQNSLENSDLPSVLATSGCPTASFSPATNFGVFGSGPQGAATADFNNDGNLDLVTANILSNNISLILGDKNGAFNKVSTFSTEVGTGPRSITTGDFNRDGAIDTATANFNTNNVAVFLGNGQGNFNIATNFNLGDGAVGPIFITTGDFNRDGILDLTTANFSSASISLLFGDGLGNFNSVAKIDITNGVGARAIGVEDFNRDGNLDLAVVNFNSNNLSILLGNGVGGVSSQTILPLDGAMLPFSIVVKDFNQDGNMDLATANGNNTVSTLFGSPSGLFTAAINFTLKAGSNPQSIQVADFNQDGNLDLVTANSNTSDLSPLLGDGKGNFSLASNIDVPGAKGIIALLVANFNQDTKLDLLTVNQTSGNISVLLNNCTLQCTGSFGNAVNVPISDAATPQAVLLADFNRDGVLDLITANAGNGNVSLLKGSRGGTFSSTNNFTTSGIQPFSITSGDFNRDGNLDIATVDLTTSNVYILLGDGNGAFGVPAGIGLTSSQPVAITTADFNRDGFLDLVTANAGSSTISTLFGLGNGQFLSPIDISLNGGVGPFALVTADFNRDGFPDLATANLASNNISIFTGGLLGFSPIINNFGVASNSPRAIAVGDVNRDGNLDLVVANFGSSNLSVLFGDGRAGFDTVKTVGLNGALKPTAVLIVDTNLDGNLDLVVANSGSDNVSLIFGDGIGGFVFNSNLPLGKGRNPSALAATDLNQDGTVDLVVANSTTVNISLLLNLCSCTITTSPSSLALGQRGVAYSQIINANGGIAPYSFSLFGGALPSGITLSSSGQISGTTDQVGIFQFTVAVADSSGCSLNQNYSLLIGSDPAANLVIEAPQDINIGLPFDITLRVVDQNGNNVIGYLGTVQFSSSDPNDLLPPNFTFNFADVGKRVFPSAITLKSLGTHRITVVDTNNSNLRGVIDFQVNKVSTKTSVNALENPTVVGQPVTFVATVLSATPATDIPSGTITFVIDGVAQTPINILNGEASFVTSSLTLGNHQIVTRYNGDNLFNSSVSNSFTQKVVKNSLGGGGGGDDDGGDSGDGGDGGSGN